MFNAKSCLFSLDGSRLGGLSSQHKLLVAAYHHCSQKTLRQWSWINIRLLSRMHFTSCVDTNHLLSHLQKRASAPSASSSVRCYAPWQGLADLHPTAQTLRELKIDDILQDLEKPGWCPHPSLCISPPSCTVCPILPLISGWGSHFQWNYHGYPYTGSRAETVCKHTLSPWWTLHCSQRFKQSYVALHFLSIVLGTLKHFISGWRGLCHRERMSI